MRQKISDLTYVIPFGRYVGSSEVEPGADEVLVGREGHRAFFIELLISAGRHGAFLVTGRRGAGKTSFVNHCIAEYEDSVFRRFLRHNVGRAFWDRVMVLLFWAVVLVGGLLLSELAELLAPLSSPGPHRVLLWVVLVPIGVALLFPCIYARAVFEVVFKRESSKNRSSTLPGRTQKEGILATVIVFLCIGVLWCLPGLSSPAWAASAMVTFLAALYLGGQSLFFVRKAIDPKEPHEPRNQRILRRLGGATLAAALATATFYALYVSMAWTRQTSAPDTSALEALIGAIAINLATALCFLSGGLALRGWYQRRAAFWTFRAKQPENRRDDWRNPIRQALRRGASNYIVPASASLLVAIFVAVAFQMPLPLLIVPGVTLVLVAARGLLIEGVDIRFMPYRGWPIHVARRRPLESDFAFKASPRWVLVGGALISMGLSLQLAQPIMAPVLEQTVHPLVAEVLEDVEVSTALSITSPGTMPILAAVHPQTASSLDNLKLSSLLPKTSLARVPGLERIGGERQDDPRGWPVFWHRFEGLLWLGLTLLVLSLLHFVQYEWIIKPHVTTREDAALDLDERPPWEDRECLSGPIEERWRAHRDMAELTLPWSVYRIWLPSMPVSVNLGFDSKLGADQIIQAMLVGLRDIYYKTFTAWTAGPANIGRLASLLGLVVLVTLAGDTWFKLPMEKEIADWTVQANALTGKTVDSGETSCEILAATSEVRPTRLPDLICRLGQGWFDAFYLDLAPKQLALASSAATTHPRGMGTSAGERLLLYSLLPYRDPPEEQVEHCVAGAPASPSCRWTQLFPSGLHVGTYHVILFCLALLAARSTVRRLPLLPYHQNLKRIEDLLDSMTARTRVTQRPTLWEPARWIYNLVADRVRETEREPLDPRTVELAFLQILEEIQHGGVRMPGIARRQLNLPAPEITFIFDELDKLGTRVDPGDDETLMLATELRALQADQERSLKLRGLLSDLKNVISSAPARFIFIGGRNLHDEWLADQTARQPLLTNIFTAEVYLPSLLTDRRQIHRHPPSSDPSTHRHHLHTRIEEFAVCQYHRATELFGNWALKGLRPSFALRPSALARERFAPGNRDVSLEASIEPWLCHHGELAGQPVSADDRQRLTSDFVAFLTLRSMGNPKRLKELLASFIRPAAREVAPPGRWQLACRHVLRLRDAEIFRIQLTASIYKHLSGEFESRMVDRDDKMAISIFFLSDFLFKFHRRAFSWANLERVDELTHIHRAPDLREIQEEIVDLFSERFLHRVLNGMYSFRFRSDVAREIEYISRRSAAEMAALNFTLDESQSLKALYLHSLELREHKEGPTPGLVAGLGELYEFDQEYETARHYYRRAIDILDQRLCEKSGSPKAVKALLRGEHSGMQDARTFLPWGEVRLRLMLQIGMTFENTRSVEHAVTEYRAARTLARAMVRACLALDEKEIPQMWFSERSEEPRKTPAGRRHTLKHMSIVFQPVFAEAWASQKVTGAVDTANSLVENAIGQLRDLLPFVREAKAPHSEDRSKPAHANLSLTVSQLHNKAGDLYFFKGRQPVPWDKMNKDHFWAPDKKDRDTEGYLLRAHYHYALSLHEIRRFTRHRVISSQYRLSLSSDPAPTLAVDALPDFLWRAVASSVNDMAEATLARTSLFGLLHYDHVESPEGKPLEDPVALEPVILEWLALDDDGTNVEAKLALPFRSTAFPLGSRLNWLGAWKGTENAEIKRDGNCATETGGGPGEHRAPSPDLLRFEGADLPATRLLVSIHLCRTGARFFERGGYLEYAARELLQVADVVTKFLWWLRAVQRIVSWSASGTLGTKLGKEVKKLVTAILRKDGELGSEERKGGLHPLLEHLSEFALDTLSAADRLFRQGRQRMAGDRSGGLIGNSIPTDALTLAYSLRLWLESPAFCSDEPEGRKPYDDLLADVNKLVDTWLDPPRPSDAPRRPRGREDVWSALERHRFPLLNRLNGLELLVNDFVLNRWCGAGEELEETRAHLEELLDFDEQYAAPLHFTPQQSGMTCALFYVRAWSLDSLEDGPSFSERVFRTAQRDLRVSEEMFSLRRAFYESISDLYYLYDDFNDRQIHVKHSLQMAAAELTTLLAHLLEELGPPTDRGSSVASR